MGRAAALSVLKMAKGEIDAGALHFAPLRNTVHPSALTARVHHQKVTIGQWQRHFQVSSCAVAELKIPRRPE